MDIFKPFATWYSKFCGTPYFEGGQCFVDSSRFAEPITSNERWPWWAINRTILIYK